MIKNKRGQFYLIAAIIIIGILLSFSTSTNEIKKQNIDRSELYSLFVETNLEKTKIIDKDYEYINNRLERFINIYPEINKIYIVIKKEGNEEILLYENGEISDGNLDYNFNLEDNSYSLIIIEGENQYAIKG